MFSLICFYAARPFCVVDKKFKSWRIKDICKAEKLQEIFFQRNSVNTAGIQKYLSLKQQFAVNVSNLNLAYTIDYLFRHLKCFCFLAI